MKQTERLFLYLVKYGKINPLEAWTELGIYRLAAVVFELRKAGWKITTNRIEVKNKFDEICQVAEYKMEPV